MIAPNDAMPPTAEPMSTPGALARALGLAAALYLGYAVGITTLNAYAPPLPPVLWAVIGALSTLAYLFVVVYAIGLLARPRMSVRLEALIGACALLLFLTLNPMVWEAVRLIRTGTSFWELFAQLTSPASNSFFDIVTPFFLILTGTFFGRLIARIVRERALLVPVALIAGLVDFWGVYWGPVSIMSEQAPSAVSGLGSAATVAASVPTAAMQQLSGPMAMLAHFAPPESIGIGDFVFLAFFLACACRLGYSARRFMWGIFIGLLLASAIMAAEGQTFWGYKVEISYLPGLVFICGGILLANLRAWRLTRQEWAMTGALVAILATFIGIAVARTEMAKPQMTQTQYTLAALDAPALARETLARVATRHDGVTVIPVAGDFMYILSDGAPQLAKWVILALARPARPTLRNTSEYFIIGEALPAGKGWQVAQQSSIPPKSALGVLRKVAQGDERTLLAGARGIPTFALLAHVDDYARRAHGQKVMVIRLLPDHALLLAGTGKTLATLPYPR
ncbi:MAG TPA: hypothetical protein VGL77_17385 [Armatimonadota bacterium]|jgi:hypothetical protein